MPSSKQRWKTRPPMRSSQSDRWLGGSACGRGEPAAGSAARGDGAPRGLVARSLRSSVGAEINRAESARGREPFSPIQRSEDSRIKDSRSGISDQGLRSRHVQPYRSIPGADAKEFASVADAAAHGTAADLPPAGSRDIQFVADAAIARVCVELRAELSRQV
jgi:hypothetical protein